MDSFLDNRSPEDKKQLLRSVSKTIFNISQTLPELDVLDFNISKTDRRMTFSVGYKGEIRANQKFDLSNMFVLSKDNLDNDLCERKNTQRRCHDNQDHNISKNQDMPLLVRENTKDNVPLCKRPEFSRKLDSPEDAETSDIIPVKFEDLHTSIHHLCSTRLRSKITNM